MRELWAIICNRGCDTPNNLRKPPAGSVKVKGVVADEVDEYDEDEMKAKGKGKAKEDVPGSSRSRPKPLPAAGGSGSDNRKVPKIVVDGGNTYIEFPDGMHSELSCLLKSLVPFLLSCSLRLCR
jgi:hypothetical protein